MLLAGVLRSLSFPQMLDRRDNIAPAHNDTCRWILDLDDFKNWTLQPRGLLWIKGKPGAGKSTLMAFLYNQLNKSQELQQPPAKDRGIQLDFFFSARGTELQHTPLGMLRSLLNQLYDSDETVRPPVRKIFEDRCRKYGYGDNHWEWTQVKLEELLADAILESARRQQVMIFVDALDEAGAKSARHVATYFHRLTGRADQLEAAVKICISCRHYPIASDAQAVNIIVEAHNRGDIASYIEDAFVGIATRENQKELSDLTEHLIRRADGVFQWIHLLVPSIERKITDCEPLDHIYSWLREVPTGLEEIYVYIINHVIEKHKQKQSLLLFQWVCLAERPLTVKELRYALATENVEISLSQKSGSQPLTSPESLENTSHFIDSDDRMKTRIKALSGGLAEVAMSARHNQIVQVVHQSVNDFLCKGGFELISSRITARTSYLDGGETILQCQATLYRSCLISVAIYVQVWETTYDWIREPEEIAEEIGLDDSFFGYAMETLFSHAKKAAGSRLGILTNEVDFLKSIIESWFQFNARSTFMVVRQYPRFSHGAILLHVTAACDLIEIMEYLLDRTEHVDTTDYFGNTAFHHAAQQGHIRASKILCERGASCGAKNDDGNTPLTGAADHGSLELFEWLLHQEAMTEICDNKDDALIIAAKNGHTKVVQTLLKAHADVNAQHVYYGTCLHAAASQGHVETVRMLLDAHADVNAQSGHYGTCLQAAAYCGNVEVVRILLDAHADVNAPGGMRGNCLQAAAYCGNLEVVQTLLDAHADVNAQGGYHGTCLQAAADGGNVEVVRILLDAHADVNAQGGHSGNCLQAAAFRGNVEVVRILLDAHADVNAQGGAFRTCLQAAAFCGNAETVRILLDSHADVNARCDRYGNALQVATVKGQIDTVRMLLAAHADVNVQDDNYENAIQAAILEGQTDVLRILWDVSVDSNAQGGKYQSAIIDILSAGCSENVQSPVEAGGSPPPLDALNRNPLHIAVSDGLKPLDRINKILHLPFFKLALDSRDKLFRTPLHAAIYKGRHPSCAIKLLSLGADPSILDGYGRNVVDWIQADRYWMGLIKPHCTRTLPTRHETQSMTACQSVLLLAKTILNSLSNLQWPLVQQLGHFFLFLNDENRATYLFQLHLFRKAGMFRTKCSTCGRYISDSIHVCRRCPNVAFCSNCCRSGYRKALHKLDHEQFQIFALPGEVQHSTSTPKDLAPFLQDLMDEYASKVSKESKGSSLTDSRISSAREQMIRPSSKTIAEPEIIVCTVLLGIVGVLVRYVYQEIR
ncbi:unnamed protein product [Penicillium olsonii]|nr:unnamed protein product [Penicillium olsonii]